MSAIHIDGTGITPGTEKCKCGSACEFPCWQRLGIAEACRACGCPPLTGGPTRELTGEALDRAREGDREAALAENRLTRERGF